MFYYNEIHKSLEGENDMCNESDLAKFREDERARAEAEGTTIEKKLNEFERFTGSKEYVDILRLLLDVKAD